MNELKARGSPYRPDGRVEQSYLLLKIKLDEEIIRAEDRIREQKESKKSELIGG